MAQKKGKNADFFAQKREVVRKFNGFWRYDAILFFKKWKVNFHKKETIKLWRGLKSKFNGVKFIAFFSPFVGFDKAFFLKMCKKLV